MTNGSTRSCRCSKASRTARDGRSCCTGSKGSGTATSPRTWECPEGQHVLVRDGLIAEISDRPIPPGDAQVIDIGGRTLMPGMIDAHVHAYASDVDFQKVGSAGEPYRTAHATRMLGHALDCGF